VVVGRAIGDVGIELPPRLVVVQDGDGVRQDDRHDGTDSVSVVRLLQDERLAGPRCR
jgi:hypothetical protein